MGFTFLYLFAVFVVQFSRCVFTMTAVCRPSPPLKSVNLLNFPLRCRSVAVCRTYLVGYLLCDRRLGGHKWIRTTDLTLIRRAL